MKAGAANEDVVDARDSSPASGGTRGDEVASVQDFLRNVLRERDQEIEWLKTQLGELKSISAENEALRAQAEQALALTRQKLTKILDQGLAAEQSMTSCEERLASLETEHSAIIQSFLDAQERIAAGENERGELGQIINSLQRELANEAAEKVDLEQQAAEAAEWTFKLSADRRAAEMETARTKRALIKHDKMRERLELEVGALRGQIRQLKADLNTGEADRTEIERRVDEVFGELAEVSQFLRSSEAQAAHQRDVLGWYVRVLEVLLTRTSGLEGLLPVSIRQKRAFRRLAALRLFDAEAYLRRYPDVRASGQDPLRHYVSHGMAEGRFF